MPPPGATEVVISTALMDTWTGNINVWMAAHVPPYQVTQRKKGPDVWNVWLLESLTQPAKDTLQADLNAELSGTVTVADA